MDLFEVRAECDGFVLRDGEAGAHEQHFEARDVEGRHDGRSAKFRQNVARFRLYRRRSLQVSTRFTAFFKIYHIIQLKILKFINFCKILQDLQKVC